MRAQIELVGDLIIRRAKALAAMIERLRAASEPFWRDESAVILDDGAFQPAMRLVPPEEAQSLWVEFDAKMERMYAIWAANRSAAC